MSNVRTSTHTGGPIARSVISVSRPTGMVSAAGVCVCVCVCVCVSILMSNRVIIHLREYT